MLLYYFLIKRITLSWMGNHKVVCNIAWEYHQRFHLILFQMKTN